MVDRVMAIPLRINPMNDVVIWKRTPDWIYSVKSGYHIALSLMVDEEASINTQNDSLWKQIWKIQVAPKSLNLVWRACQNILPVRANLKRRMPQIGPVCPCCGEMEEIVEHIFLNCYKA